MMLHIKREVKLAITAIAAVIILIWGINFLKAKALFDKNNVFYGIYDRVDGLKVSSSVIYRGYSVGQVNSIQFVGERFDKVLVQFSVGKNLEIPVNTIAAIQSADLMGSKAINLLPGDSSEYAESGDTLQSRMSLGLMEQLNKQLEPLKHRAENVLVSLDSVLFALQEIFNESTGGNVRTSLKSVSRTLDNIEQASGTLNELLNKESQKIDFILSDIQSVTSNLKNNNEQISKGMNNVVTLTDSLKAANLAETVRSLNAVLLQADSVMQKINTGQGTLGSMVNDAQLYDNLARVSTNLNKLLVEFRQNPKRFVNFSLIGSSGRSQGTAVYGIAISESIEPLPLNSSLYLSYPDLQELRRNGRYIYLISPCEDLKQAQKILKEVQQTFTDAYIVKID